ncbi:hypothetical protein GCM10023175_70600 [Pseudonocardia xishanensis]|uniref:Uncharacterized protein n=1 Tax=Pseudonocardia xishanensis TaxID=630995 RepID=A0ABP8S5L3_9PSEU
MRLAQRTKNQIQTILSIEGPTEEAQRKLRSNMATARSAMDHLEDTPLFDSAHQVLDACGQLAREQFPDGCHFDYDDDGYHQSCPVALAHNRVGLSPGMIILDSECSICHQDPEDCDHITGHEYGAERCIKIIKEAEIIEVSLVARPNFPDARISRVGVPLRDIKEALGDSFSAGDPVLCGRCLGECEGVVETFA